MLKLKSIDKDYKAGDSIVKALRNLNVEFRENEFVSILGPSGCGKTTLLNLIGGLDRYTRGDLLIEGKSTKDFTDSDWDSYRNNTIGFIFQSYNLIPHLSVLGNVEIALTLSGISFQERKKRATEALANVGLSDQLNKRPNQLSGGQMQRVAIARALVNNPKILLADEPTGALDTKTSDQTMELLKKLAKDRLVIMVTHNNELAQNYSTRIVELLDGKLLSDSNPYTKETDDKGKTQKYIGGKQSSMPFFTALTLSFNNLRTKRARTILTSIAGSIGIIGIALVLAISSGMSNYINAMQTDTLSGYPITIQRTAFDVSNFEMGNRNINREGVYPEENIVIPYNPESNINIHINRISEDYVSYVEAMDSGLYNSISYSYGLTMNVIGKNYLDEYKLLDMSKISLQQLPDSKEFVDSQYDLLSGVYPSNSNEALLIVDRRNRLDLSILDQLGINYTEGENLVFEDFLGKTLKLIFNNQFYSYSAEDNKFIEEKNYDTLYNHPESKAITITGVLRIKESSSTSLLGKGIAYTSALTEELIAKSKNSDIVIAQKANPTRNMITGNQLGTGSYNDLMIKLGGIIIPENIMIYPKTFESKDAIKAYLDSYNVGKPKTEHIVYMDLAEMITGAMGTLINTISIILSAFAAISLVVSSIMIGIITYVSVVERTREIGVLRSIGARKKDISRVFNAETIIIGFTAGLIGVIISLILSIPVNAIVENLVEVKNIASLPFISGVALVAISMTLTFIAGLIPSRIAAKKDPVVALRTE